MRGNAGKGQLGTKLCSGEGLGRVQVTENQRHATQPQTKTPLRTLRKILFLRSSWVIYKQKIIPKGDIETGSRA